MTVPAVIGLTDSRRLFGPNLLWDRPGAVLDVTLPRERADEAITAWQAAATEMLAAVGWSDELTRVRRWPGGATLAISAPIDTLFTATEVNEWAFAAANAALGGPPAPPLQQAAATFREQLSLERKPALLAMARA